MGNKTRSIFLIFNQLFETSAQQLNTMERIFLKLGQVKDLKGELRYWCRQNGIKISFTVNMTLTKSKVIFRKLQNTYKKGFGKIKSRWLQNELKLFHFAVLAVSVLHHIKISQFRQQHWQILEEAFPNKLQPILEYETKNFTINKNILKKKWEDDEDNLLSKIVSQKDEQPKWNQIAIQLFTQSNRQFFRNGKQCRQRWLNHLDKSIKHQKWTQEEDITLMKGVFQNGKKWSRIMRCFQNQRTQHMIKNRFLSLILKYKKSYPFIQDEDLIIKKIFQDMGICSDDKIIYESQILNERRLRPKINQEEKYEQQQDEEEDEDKPEDQEENKEVSGNVESKDQDHENKNETILIPQTYPVEYIKFNSYGSLPTPSPTFVNPMPFLNYGTVFPNFDYFQCYMNSFYSQLNQQPFSNE